ncbi:MAG: P1 family peptidase [Desulfobacterales bacterium]|nr:P1 family peptidase [Desulfobacterales bacterium]
MKLKKRARDLGIPFEGTPGILNAITDVEGVSVGHSTIISGNGKLRQGEGPIRTGVTAIFPKEKLVRDRIFAGCFSYNGNGEMTGTAWIEESGFLESPIMLTNSHSVGIVRDTVIEWQAKNGLLVQDWSLPVVGETYDGYLNDINGFHVKKEHVYEAIENAVSGPVKEGNVGGGTGMVCHEFKGGIGTSSRKTDPKKCGKYTVGVLVQANHGMRNELRVAGVPVCNDIKEHLVWSKEGLHESGSIIFVVATDAPLLPHQLKRLARRAAFGIARNGSIASNYSGDLMIAFSTANRIPPTEKGTEQVKMLLNDHMDYLFEATVQASEEAIINALIAAETMTGIDDKKVIALPQDKLIKDLKRYNRLGI